MPDVEFPHFNEDVVESQHELRLQAERVFLNECRSATSDGVLLPEAICREGSTTLVLIPDDTRQGERLYGDRLCGVLRLYFCGFFVEIEEAGCGEGFDPAGLAVLEQC